MSQQFCLKWNNHTTNMLQVFENLLTTEALVDVTLACDGLSLKAHKMVLSACSPFFQSLFLENPCKHPIVIMKDMRYCDLKAIIDFMYRGEVNVSHDQLSALLKTAETLKVKGLAEVTGENKQASGIVQQEIVQNSSTPTPVPPSAQRTDTPPLQGKRKRGRPRKRSLSDSNRSDDEGVPTKIKETNSDVDELSGDASMEATSDNRSGGGPISCNSQSQVPIHSSNNVNNFSKSHLSTSQDPQVEEPVSGDENEFEVEPSKLLEQTLTTENVPSNSQNSTPISLPPVSGLEISRRSMSSTDSVSQALVPVSIPSDSLGSNLQGPDSPQDVKPQILSFDDSPISPVAGTSHGSDRSLMMYMDQSGVASIPGPSNFQDNSALVPHDSQPQELSVVSIEHPNFQIVNIPIHNNVYKVITSEEIVTDDDIDIQAVLKATDECDILTHASIFIFTDKDRSRLADILIGHELVKNIDKRLSQQRLEFLASKIVKTFPFEEKANWISSFTYSNKIIVKGKLIRRYNAWRSVIECDPIETILNDSHLIFFESDIEENSELEVSLICLRNTDISWTTAKNLWRKTMKFRLENLYSANDGIYNYFKRYPCLNEPLGFTLLEDDFRFLYPSAQQNLFSKWPKFSLFVANILKKKDAGFLYDGNTSEVRMMKILMHLSEIFPVITAMKKSGVGSWRPSTAESQDAFLLVIKSTQDLEHIFQNRSEKLSKFGLKLQPIPVVIGISEKFEQCFIILDTVTYEIDNPLKAIDLTFKLFHSLHIPYPPECDQIWTFLQQAVYKIYTCKDKKLVGSELVSSYMDFLLTHNSLLIP